MGFFENLYDSHHSRRLTIHQHGHRCYSEGLTNYEQHLVTKLSQGLNPKQYYIFNNVTIPSSNSITTQIDHIIVSEFGIFVIESKDYCGWIFGNASSKKWLRVYFRAKRIEFQNPILQNFSHVSALKEQLPYLGKCFFNVVVFSHRCELKENRISNVVYEDELIDYIKGKTKKWLKQEEMMMTIGKLSMLCQTNIVSSEMHVMNLKLSGKTSHISNTVFPNRTT